MAIVPTPKACDCPKRTVDTYAGLTINAAMKGGHYVCDVPPHRRSDDFGWPIQILFAGDLEECLDFMKTHILKGES